MEGAVARGGRAKDRDAPERRCIASGASGPTARLIRFVLSPEGTAVPDLAGKLPGRGAWLTAERAAAERAVKKRLFSRAFRQPVVAAEGLPDLLETLLARRLVDTVALARKAGQAVTGFEKVRERLRRGPALMLTAREAAADGRRKLRRIAPDAPEIALLTQAELGLAFGREFAIHAALDAGGIADRALHEADRLRGFRAAPTFAVAEDLVPVASEDGKTGAGCPSEGD
ncbi:MAG: RNA-binding protein [Pseudomonadota bacterium]